MLSAHLRGVALPGYFSLMRQYVAAVSSSTRLVSQARGGHPGQAGAHSIVTRCQSWRQHGGADSRLGSKDNSMFFFHYSLPKSAAAAGTLVVQPPLLSAGGAAKAGRHHHQKMQCSSSPPHQQRPCQLRVRWWVWRGARRGGGGGSALKMYISKTRPLAAARRCVRVLRPSSSSKVAAGSGGR